MLNKPLTQQAIDARGPWYPVKEVTFPIRGKTVPDDHECLNRNRYLRVPHLSKSMLPIGGLWECFSGDRSECIPGADIIRVLRQRAKANGVTVQEIQDKPRWAKVAGTVVVLVCAAVISIGLLLHWVRP